MDLSASSSEALASSSKTKLGQSLYEDTIRRYLESTNGTSSPTSNASLATSTMAPPPAPRTVVSNTSSSATSSFPADDSDDTVSDKNNHASATGLAVVEEGDQSATKSSASFKKSHDHDRGDIPSFVIQAQSEDEALAISTLCMMQGSAVRSKAKAAAGAAATATPKKQQDKRTSKNSHKKRSHISSSSHSSKKAAHSSTPLKKRRVDMVVAAFSDTGTETGAESDNFYLNVNMEGLSEIERKRLASRISSRRTREREKQRTEYFTNVHKKLSRKNEKLRGYNDHIRLLIKATKKELKKKKAVSTVTFQAPAPVVKKTKRSSSKKKKAAVAPVKVSEAPSPPVAVEESAQDAPAPPPRVSEPSSGSPDQNQLAMAFLQALVNQNDSGNGSDNNGVLLAVLLAAMQSQQQQEQDSEQLQQEVLQKLLLALVMQNQSQDGSNADPQQTVAILMAIQDMQQGQKQQQQQQQNHQEEVRQSLDIASPAQRNQVVGHAQESIPQAMNPQSGELSPLFGQSLPPTFEEQAPPPSRAQLQQLAMILSAQGMANLQPQRPNMMAPPTLLGNSNAAPSQHSLDGSSSSASSRVGNDFGRVPALQQQAPYQIAAQMEQLAAKTLQQSQRSQQQQPEHSSSKTWQSTGFAQLNQLQRENPPTSTAKSTGFAPTALPQQQQQVQPAKSQQQLLALQHFQLQQQYFAMMASRSNNFYAQR